MSLFYDILGVKPQNLKSEVGQLPDLPEIAQVSLLGSDYKILRTKEIVGTGGEGESRLIKFLGDGKQKIGVAKRSHLTDDDASQILPRLSMEIRAREIQGPYVRAPLGVVLNGDVEIIYDSFANWTMESFLESLSRSHNSLSFSNYANIVHPIAYCVTSMSLAALKECHQVGTVHLDLKPGNLFFSVAEPGSESDVTRFQLGDFGMAVQVGPHPHEAVSLPAPRGSREFMAPEVVGSFRIPSFDAHQYAACRASDVWSLGIQTLLLFLGYLPSRTFINNLSGSRMNESKTVEYRLEEWIQKDHGADDETSRRWQSLHAFVRCFICDCLREDPLDRLQVDELLSKYSPDGMDIDDGSNMRDMLPDASGFDSLALKTFAKYIIHALDFKPSPASASMRQVMLGPLRSNVTSPASIVMKKESNNTYHLRNSQTSDYKSPAGSFAQSAVQIQWDTLPDLNAFRQYYSSQLQAKETFYVSVMELVEAGVKDVELAKLVPEDDQRAALLYVLLLIAACGAPINTSTVYSRKPLPNSFGRRIQVLLEFGKRVKELGFDEKARKAL